jgi:uncharacterized protein with GYD domain
LAQSTHAVELQPDTWPFERTCDTWRPIEPSAAFTRHPAMRTAAMTAEPLPNHGGLTMATYILLGQFTDQGIKNVRDTTKRAEALKNLAKKFNATVTAVYWTLGQFDVAAIVDAQDDASVNALLLSLGALGNVRTQTLRAFSADEMGQILGRMG